MLQEIRLACSAAAWGVDGFVDAIGIISEAGYDGVECSSLLVGAYEDRLHVFEEMLSISGAKLAAMMQHADFLTPETADAEVERVANTARFLAAAGAKCLMVTPRNTAKGELTTEEWTTVAAVLVEMAARCAEFEMALTFRPRAGAIAGTEKEIKRLAELVPAEKLKLCLDTAELLLADIPLDKFMKTYRDRVAYIRLRDVSASKKRSAVTSNKPGTAPQFGRGALNLEEVGSIIEKAQYSGWVSVEIAGESHRPKPAVQDAFTLVMRKTGLFI